MTHLTIAENGSLLRRRYTDCKYDLTALTCGYSDHKNKEDSQTKPCLLDGIRHTWVKMIQRICVELNWSISHLAERMELDWVQCGKSQGPISLSLYLHRTLPSFILLFPTTQTFFPRFRWRWSQFHVLKLIEMEKLQLKLINAWIQNTHGFYFGKFFVSDENEEKKMEMYPHNYDLAFRGKRRFFLPFFFFFSFYLPVNTHHSWTSLQCSCLHSLPLAMYTIMLQDTNGKFHSNLIYTIRKYHISIYLPSIQEATLTNDAWANDGIDEIEGSHWDGALWLVLLRLFICYQLMQITLGGLRSVWHMLQGEELQTWVLEPGCQSKIEIGIKEGKYGGKWLAIIFFYMGVHVHSDERAYLADLLVLKMSKIYENIYQCVIINMNACMFCIAEKEK